ncbi:MAG: DNA methyltransferase [Dehalococcoidia bacterium]|nr:DNA methyltransferase [Dehalococcoidia bacterium]
MFFPIYVNPQSLKVSLTKDGDFQVEVWPRKSTGQNGRWMWGHQKAESDISLLEARLVKRRGEYDIFVRDYREREGKERTRKFKTIWDAKELNTQDGTQEVKALIGSDAMPYPKPVALLKDIVTMGAEDDSIVLDFFAGSGTTAHAVLDLNKQDGGDRKFILVQLPEPTGRTDYPTIADIGKERIRRVIAKMQKGNEGKLLTERETPYDLGFRVFKLATSNYRSWAGVSESTPQAYGDQIALYADPLVEGWTAENVLYEVAIKEGYGLNCEMEQVHGIKGNTVYRVADPDKGQWFHICLDDALQPATLKALDLTADRLFICRDKALDDKAAANLALQCRLKTI